MQKYFKIAAVSHFYLYVHKILQNDDWGGGGY